MCGLAGLFDARGRRAFEPSLLRAMRDSLRHRGPDSAGEHLAPGIALGHRRLSIIDVGGGHQPMYNEDGKVGVVFNGEIYNFQSLVRELEAAGHVFRSRCDTEVIVHAWEQWGPQSVERFRGMFAFALWDEGQQTLFMARDHLGKKPLYYAITSDGVLAFASELKAVIRHPGVSTALDLQAVEDYFTYGYIPDPRSIYMAVRKLPPAHRLLWRRGGDSPRIDAYWDLRLDGGGAVEGDGTAELMERLREATAMRLISDVPLGAFLSGGVDSSAVVATMAQLSETPIKTFNISFRERDYDESEYASRMAVRYGTEHHSRQSNPDDFALIDRLASIFDEPFGDSSALPTFRVCELARESVTVALSGDGGDEVFAGYRRYVMSYHTEQIRRLLPHWARAPIFGSLGRFYPKADWAPRWARAKTTFEELAVDGGSAYYKGVSLLADGQRARLFSPRLRRELQGYSAAEVLRRHFAEADTDDMLKAIQYVDIKTWLPGGILVKVDRTSMANSLEVRAPLLDYPTVEWGVNLAPALKIRGNRGKAVLKQALEPLVDHDLLYRPKRGFSMPLARWFRGPLRPKLAAMAAAGGALSESGLFEMSEVRKLVAGHESGLHDQSAALWLLLMFDAFLNKALHGQSEPVAANAG